MKNNLRITAAKINAIVIKCLIKFQSHTELKQYLDKIINVDFNLTIIVKLLALENQRFS